VCLCWPNKDNKYEGAKNQSIYNTTSHFALTLYGAYNLQTTYCTVARHNPSGFDMEYVRLLFVGALFYYSTFLPSLKEIMRNDPLFTMIQSPKLGTGQKEETPVNVPLPLLALTVGFLQDWFQRSILPILVQVVQPPVRRLFIVGTIDTPVLFDTKVTSKVQQQVITGHGTTGKKVIRHPTLVKVIGVILVGKNVHKELSRWFQKTVDLVHQVVVILHVFKHFDRHDAVVALDDTQCALVVSDIAL
jgi:hypothetical protein